MLEVATTQHGLLPPYQSHFLGSGGRAACRPAARSWRKAEKVLRGGASLILIQGLPFQRCWGSGPNIKSFFVDFSLFIEVGLILIKVRKMVCH